MKSLRLFLEDADRDAALEKLKSKRAKAAEKSQRTRDEFYKSAEENKKKSESLNKSNLQFSRRGTWRAVPHPGILSFSAISSGPL